ncbi:GntR family transcriptional regulator [Leucobacter japonicus]|uniref:GntR family transcriptional regulator n=1 Tax=Leucobacter japonicus TaxID=1461259 RepID=UPI0006A7BD75|nr:GntR family transcriptional regulator [Leucobacter japonicus]
MQNSWSGGDIFYSARLLDAVDEPAARPVVRRTSRDSTVDRLQARILSGDLRPGATLRAASIAADLEVSPAAAREAITVLESRHLVELRGGKSGTVISPSVNWFVAIAASAAGLSAVAADQGIAHATPTQLVEFSRAADAAIEIWTQPEVDQLAGGEAVWDLIDLLAQYAKNIYLAAQHRAQRPALAFGVRNLFAARNPRMIASTIDALAVAVREGDRLEGTDIVRDLYAYLVSGVIELN